MRLLLDTQVFLWWVGDAGRLSAKAKRAIAQADNECWLSIASVWEMAIKSSLGKLTIDQPIERFVPEQLAANAFRLLGLDMRHVARAASMPRHHRDPFDRLLVAQAEIEGLTVVTSDGALAAYGIETLSS
jgi:PIN domain nuclease of toxin-antitoxin system